MTTLREAAEMALEALEYGHFAVADQTPHAGVMAYLEATDKLRTALADHSERDLEMGKPVAWIFTWYEIAKDRHVRRIIDCEEKPNIPGYDLIPLYTAPSQRKPLTDKEIIKIWNDMGNDPIAPSVFSFIACVRKTEQAHGIGGEE